MGRELKRVPIGFDWPMGEVWWGYLYVWRMQEKLKEYGDEFSICPTCKGTGEVPWKAYEWSKPEDKWWCPQCEGEGIPMTPNIELPKGDGWQMWENVSEGSPISPVFETPEELARWLTDEEASSFADRTATYEQWLRMIKGRGFASSAVLGLEGLKSGVEAGI